MQLGRANSAQPQDRDTGLLVIAACLLALSAGGCGGAAQEVADAANGTQFLADLARNVLAAWLF